MSDGSDLVRERWERSGEGWSRRADLIREMGMPVSTWMIDQLDLQPAHVVLELAAGPGDTGFMAAELVRPGGRLICSDAVEAMLDIARERATRQGVRDVEFRRLELEWIDLATASVDAVLCRWGIMFLVDPGAALREMRRVLRPGGRVALAVWHGAERNPWITIPTRALVELGHVEPPDPAAPGALALAQPDRLQDLLEDGGFTEVELEAIPLTRRVQSVESYLEENLDLSRSLADVREGLDQEEWSEVVRRTSELARPFAGADGGLALPGCALVVSASA